MKRTIITGASGFVGANLTRRLLDEGHEVHLLVRKNYNPWRIESIIDAVRIHQVRFEDLAQLEGIVANIKPEWVFHLAAHGAYSWQKDLHQIIQANFIGTINLVQACVKAGFEAFINTGASSEYGFKKHAASEDEMLEPNSHYAVTKASASLFCRYTAQSRNACISTLRLYSVYGPYEDPKRLIPNIILKGLVGGYPNLTNPDTARDFIYIDDVCDAYLMAAEKTVGDASGEIFNVGTGIQTSLQQVVGLMRTEGRIHAKPEWGTMSDRIWDTNTWIADNRKIKRIIGWQPRFSFKQGFIRTLEWFRGHSDIVSKYYR
ncbi:NAD-dependent epimerase/dehydratase family protein [Thermodesulfobacteriota bacterium]